MQYAFEPDVEEVGELRVLNVVVVRGIDTDQVNRARCRHRKRSSIVTRHGGNNHLRPEVNCVTCHPERSEGSRLSSISRLIETLRSAQSDISILLLSHSPILPFFYFFILSISFLITTFQSD